MAIDQDASANKHAVQSPKAIRACGQASVNFGGGTRGAANNKQCEEQSDQ